MRGTNWGMLIAFAFALAFWIVIAVGVVRHLH